MAITRFNAKNGLSVGTGSINVIDNEGNATFVASALIGVANSTDKLAVFGTTSLTGSVFPGTNAAYDLGSTSKFWSTVFANSLTGSLTRLSDGTSYLVAGAGISITTGSNGAVTITNDGTVGDITAVNAGIGLSGGGTSGAVTLDINDSVVATVSGTTFTGVTKHNAGLSGSLTRLTDGTPYLISGTGISITTGSNGSVTINGNVGDITAVNVGIGLTGGGVSGDVTLAIDNSVVATISGSTFTGAVKFNSGLSGSLTKLTDGTSYLIAGTNIGITTGSTGAVTINNTAPIFYQWNELSPTARLNTTASVAIAGALGSSYAAQSAGTDVFFFVSGSVGTSSGVSVFGGDLTVSGTLGAQTITNLSTAGTTTALTVNGSTRGTSTTGRGITIAGAAGGGGISGGAILIDAGDGSGASSSGGAVTINAGDSTTVSSAGAVTITAGTTTSTGGTAQAGSITLSAGGLPAGGTGTAGSITLTTGNAANASSTPGNITLTSQRGKVILRQSTAAVTTGSDVFLFVTGTVGDSNKSVFAGDMIVSGSVRSFTGFSGSLTNLTDGSSYLIAGSNITITTGSNGSVTIASAATGGGDSAAQYLVLATTSSLSAERAFVPSTGLSAVDGGANGNYTLRIDDSIVATVSGTTFTGVTKHNAGLSGSLTRLTDGTSYLIAGSNVTITTGSNGSVTIASTAAGGGGTSYFDSTTAGSIYTTGSAAFKGGEVGIDSPLDKGADVFFYVSGSSTDKSLFGGDVRVSGSLVIGTGSVTITSNDVQFGSSATRIENNSADLKFFDPKSPTGKTLADLVSGSGVLNTPQYLVLAADGVLTNERIFAAGTGITVLDGGAGNNYIVAINDSVVATVSGTTFTGVTKHSAGLSGSLTQLTDGSSYLIAGNNITITTGSTGAVTIASTASGGGGGDNAAQYLVLATTASLSAERAFVPSIGLTAVDGGANGNYTLSINDSVVATVSGTTFTGLVKVDGGLSGSLTSSNVTAGQVVVAGTAGVLSGSNNFWWDNTNIRVGIGTSTLSRSLTLSRNTESSSGQLELRTVGSISSGGFDGIYFTQGASGLTALGSFRAVNQSSGNPDLAFYTRIPTLNSESEKVRILNNGNFGIGGTNPISRLEVTGSTGDSTAATFHALNSSNTSLLLVRNDGNVGIGSATPARKLQVVSTAPIRLGTTTEYWDFLQNTSNQWAFLSNASIYSIFMDNATGNVGIGTNTTSDKLSVNGSLSVTGSALPGASNTYTLGSSAKLWSTVFATNLTGSLTQLSDGTSYLVAGTGITITSGSSGAITIASTASGGDITAVNAGIGLTGGGTTGDVSLAIDNSVVATVSGTTFTGATKHNSGLSGSLTKLVDGTSYLIAGSNVTITTGSSGAITISSTASGGSSPSYFTSTTAGAIYTTGSVAFVDGEAGIDAAADKGTNVFFYVSGSKGSSGNQPSSGVSMFGGDVVVSGTVHVRDEIIGDKSLTAGTSAITGALVVRGGPPIPAYINSYGNATLHLIGTASFGHGAGIVFGDYGVDYGVGIFEAPDDSLAIRTGNTLIVSSTFGMLVREGLPADTSGLNVLDVLNWAGTNVFNVSGSGFVGIGTTGNLTNNRLAVYSPTPTTTFAGQMLLSSDAASAAVDNGGQLNFQMYDGTSLRGSSYIKSAKENGTSGNYNSYLSFGIRQNGVATITERMRIDATGSVGIGTTLPGAKLGVNGAFRLFGSTSGYTEMQAASTTTSVTYTLPSSDATDKNRVLTSDATGSLSWTTNDGRQLYLSSSGADTYTATFTPDRTILQTGQIATVLFGSANTTTATLNGKSIKKAGNANQQDLVAGDIPSGSIQNLVYDGTDWIMAGGSAKVQTFNIISPLAITGGTAYTITITTLSRAIRTLTGNAVTNTGTTEIALPADFLCFPPNAISIESARNNSGSTLTLSLGKNGSADATVNAVSLMATGTGGTFETKSTTPTSAYSPGDRILLSLVATTGASASANVQISNLQIKYITR